MPGNINVVLMYDILQHTEKFSYAMIYMNKLNKWIKIVPSMELYVGSLVLGMHPFKMNSSQ